MIIKHKKIDFSIYLKLKSKLDSNKKLKRGYLFNDIYVYNYFINEKDFFNIFLGKTSFVLSKHTEE